MGITRVTIWIMGLVRYLLSLLDPPSIVSTPSIPLKDPINYYLEDLFPAAWNVRIICALGFRV